MLPTTFALLAEAIRNGQSFSVQACKTVGDFENYIEHGMRVEIVGVESGDVDDVLKLKFDYTKYDEYNKRFESANYYDAQNVPCKTAREVGCYKVHDILYTDVNSDPNYYFVEVDVNRPMRSYQENKQGDETYIQYLERLVTQAELV